MAPDAAEGGGACVSDVGAAADVELGERAEVREGVSRGVSEAAAPAAQADRREVGGSEG